MTLFDLTLSHYLYKIIAGNDGILKQLIQSTKRAIDLGNEELRFSLLEWLNKWGCRHISRTSHNTFSKGIDIWWQNNINAFRKTNFENMSSIVEAFNSLAKIHVSEKGRTISFGPTATAKTFFVIDPDKFIPWDKKIREDYKDDGLGYYQFLNYATELVNEAKCECKRKNMNWDSFKKSMSSDEYLSDYKLIDEYLWITKTNGIQISKEEISKICKL